MTIGDFRYFAAATRAAAAGRRTLSLAFFLAAMLTAIPRTMAAETRSLSENAAAGIDAPAKTGDKTPNLLKPSGPARSYGDCEYLLQKLNEPGISSFDMGRPRERFEYNRRTNGFIVGIRIPFSTAPTPYKKTREPDRRVEFDLWEPGEITDPQKQILSEYRRCKHGPALRFLNEGNK